MSPLQRVRWACTASLIGVFAISCLTTAGCSDGFNPVTKVAKLGVKVVGDAVHEVDVDKHAKELVGKPVEKADAAFGARIETAVDTQSRREMIVYPVKGDVLGKSRWVVEAEGNRIVALSKVSRDPGGGKDIIKKTQLEKKLKDKTPAEFATEKKFERPVLTLRSRNTGNLIRVYDMTGRMDLLGSKYCVLRFDGSDRCKEIRLVGIPASTKRDPAAR
jgi:hypothetical protein